MKFETGPSKLIVQMPCHNEEAVLPVTLATLPRKVAGVDKVEWLVIDDGSTDDTVGVARRCGVDHIVSLPRHQGLAAAFLAGLEASLNADADIIVNTDADNQYNADDIPKLVAPILEGKAEIVIGARPIEAIPHFSALKKCLQKIGSWLVRKASKSTVLDAPSGFRAMSRDAAMKLHVFNEYTYTLETIIQAGQKGMAITSVPIRTNPDVRPSRLVKSIPGYVQRQVLTILRIFVTYRPFQFFSIPGVVLFSLGFLIALRFVYFFLTGEGAGKVQSVILSALLMGVGSSLVVVGLLADLISVNRKLLEKLDWQVLRMEDRLKEKK